MDLKGEPREGVGGPKRESVTDGYSIRSESVEKGEAFERVDYEAIEDIVVLLDARTPGDSPTTDPDVARLEVDEDGPDRSQMLMQGDLSGGFYSLPPSRLEIVNHRDESLTIVGFSDTGEFFEATIGADDTGEVGALVAGRYEVTCDEIEDFLVILHVTEDLHGWIGSSDEYPFFDHLPPGEYTLSIQPPRLPEVTRSVTVTAGERKIVTAKLSVNDLPKAE